MSAEMRMWRLANPSIGRTVNEDAITEFMAELIAEDCP